MIHPLKSIKARVSSYLRKRSFHKEFIIFKELSRGRTRRFDLQWQDRNPQLGDRTKTTGYDAHYVLHTAWAARVVRQIQPERHIDISSSLYFSAILSAFVPVDFYDYRPAIINLSNLTSRPGDLMSLAFPDNSVPSISCMHTIEHIGLGRYGEPLDPDGDLKAIAELKRVTAPGGSLIFVSPIGRPRLLFNAHRIYSYAQVMEYFSGFILKEFSLIPDTARTDGIIMNADASLADKQTYGCGCFWFIKPIS